MDINMILTERERTLLMKNRLFNEEQIEANKRLYDKALKMNSYSSNKIMSKCVDSILLYEKDIKRIDVKLSYKPTYGR